MSAIKRSVNNNTTTTDRLYVGGSITAGSLVATDITADTVDAKQVFVDTTSSFTDTGDIAKEIAEIRYEILKLKHSRNEIRIANAVSRNAIRQNVDQFSKTAWTEGNVIWEYDQNAFGAEEFTVRWKRSWFDTVFDHELSILDPLIAVGDDVTGTAVFNPGTQSWDVTRPESRLIAGGGNVLEDIGVLINKKTITGELPLNPTFDGSGNVLKVFDLGAGVTHNAYIMEPDPSGPPDYPNPLAYIPDVTYPSSVVDPQTEKVVHLALQNNSESDQAFFLRLFGVQASAEVTKIIGKSEVKNFPADPDIVPILNCNEYTRIPTGSGDVIDTSANPSVVVERGILLLSGEIDFGYVTDDETHQLFSLWAEVDNTINDSLLVTLPSNVIHSSNVVDIITFGTPARPSARFQVGDSRREYNRAEEVSDDIRFFYLNYVKIESQSIGTGFWGRSSPGHAMWYMWRPGYSIWAFGNDNHSNASFDDQDAGFFAKRWLKQVTYQGDQLFPNSSTPDPPLAVNPNQIIGDLEYPGPVTLNVANASTPTDTSFVTMLVGKSDDEDSLWFVSLAGDLTSQPGIYSAGEFTTVVSSLAEVHRITIGGSVASGEITIPSPLVTRSTAFNFEGFLQTVSGVPICFGPNPCFGRFKYGTVTSKAYNVNDTLNSLFPPLWYLQTQQGYSIEVRNMQNSLDAINQYLDDYVDVSIKAALTSIEKLGLTNELIANKIFTVETQVNLRIDQLTEYMVSAISSLSTLIQQTQQDMVQLLGGSGPEQIFASAFLKLAPSILEKIPAVGPLLSIGFTIGTDIAEKQYRTAVIAETTSRLVGRAYKALTEGNLVEGTTYAVYGTLASSAMLRALDTTGGVITVDPEGAEKPYAVTDPDLLANLTFVKPPNPLDGNFRNEYVIEDVNALSSANSDILAEIRAIETADGFAPFDPTSPMVKDAPTV